MAANAGLGKNKNEVHNRRVPEVGNQKKKGSGPMVEKEGAPPEEWGEEDSLHVKCKGSGEPGGRGVSRKASKEVGKRRTMTGVYY